MRKMLNLFIICFLLLNSTAAFADSGDPVHIAGDILFERPFGFVATVFGGGLFVLCLPFALASGSVKSTADALVGQPFRYTFTRPLGDSTTDVSSAPTAESEKKPKE